MAERRSGGPSGSRRGTGGSAVQLPRVNTVRAKGRTYHYHRPTGERLPDDPLKRAARVAELEGRRGEDRRDGTLADLILLYRRGERWKTLAAATRRDYEKWLDWLEERYGDQRMRDLDRESVIGIRDQAPGNPRGRDMMVTVLSILCGQALDRPRRFGLDANPCAGVARLYRPGGYRPWSRETFEAAIAAADPCLRRALLVGWLTGQRISDVVALTWPDWDPAASGFRITQRKTGDEIWVPAGPELRAVVEDTPRDAVVMLLDRNGRPWTPARLDRAVRELMHGIGRPGHVFHGLRHSRGYLLAEQGATAHQIMAVLGLKTLAMAQRYTRGADQRRLAESATAGYVRAGTEGAAGTPGERPAAKPEDRIAKLHRPRSKKRR